MKVILANQIEEILERYYKNEPLVDILKSMNIKAERIQEVFKKDED
ncbi:MAG: hypothetical protein ACRCWG_06515 [Sarcina sp.]